MTSSETAARLRRYLESQQDAMVEHLAGLVEAESPSLDRQAQAGPQKLLTESLTALGFEVNHVPGNATGGYLQAMPAGRPRYGPLQLVVGHSDTVWPLGTLAARPVRVENGRFYGPGSYDMKAGLTQAVFALAALRELDAEPAVAPVVMVNSDEEIGSRETLAAIARMAEVSDRVFVLEPSLGPAGKLKTGRKGVGRFTITVIGRASHAGLAPDEGASAILELSRVVQELFQLNDPERGVSVNVGTIEGGIRPNVVAPEGRAVVDVRVWRHADAAEVEEAINRLTTATPGTAIEISGGFGRPPMEFTAEGRRLWELAERAAAELGIAIAAGTAGGASDGNTTSLHAPTLDGMGAVGDGAHAEDEYVVVDGMVERSALLARLLLEPPMEQGP